MNEVTVYTTHLNGDRVKSPDPLEVDIAEVIGQFSSLEEAFRLGEIIGSIRAFDSVRLDGRTKPMVLRNLRYLNLLMNSRGDEDPCRAAMALCENIGSHLRDLRDEDEAKMAPIQFTYSEKPGKLSIDTQIRTAAVFSLDSPSLEQKDEILSWLTDCMGLPSMDFETGKRMTDGQTISTSPWFAVKNATKILDLHRSSHPSSGFIPATFEMIDQAANNFSIKILIQGPSMAAFKMRFSDWF